MPNFTTRWTLVCGAMLMSSAATHAHHSAAMFDHTQCGSVSGTIRNLQWQYPHSWLWIVADDGKDTIWGFEMPAPSALQRNPEWSREALPKGDKVTVYFSPLSDGRPAGLANAIEFATGKILHAAPNAATCEKQLWTQGESGSPGDAVFKGNNATR